MKGVFWLLPDTNVSKALLVPRVSQWVCWHIHQELLPAKMKFWLMYGVWGLFFFDYVLKVTTVSCATWPRCSQHDPLSFPCDSMCQKPGWCMQPCFPQVPGSQCQHPSAREVPAPGVQSRMWVSAGTQQEAVRSLTTIAQKCAICGSGTRCFKMSWR